MINALKDSDLTSLAHWMEDSFFLFFLSFSGYDFKSPHRGQNYPLHDKLGKGGKESY